MGIIHFFRRRLSFFEKKKSKSDIIIEKLDILLELIEEIRKREQISIPSRVDDRSNLQRISRRLKR
jgi:hypothetical protein